MNNDYTGFDWHKLAVLLMLALTLGLILDTTSVLAHGEATITVTPDVVTAGGTIRVEGEGVEPDEVFTITLEGVRSSTTLGTVTVGDDEDFHQEFTVPADTSPGSYQVVATSDEGEVLTAELTIEADVAQEQPTVSAEPSADLMQLDRSKSGGQLAGIILVLVISTVLGIILIRA